MDELLPNSLRDIAEAIGVEKVMLIIEKHRGQRLWIPKQPTLDWSLLLLLGYESAYKLSALCGGSQIEIPNCHFLGLKQRNQNIRSDRNMLTIGAIAVKYKISRRQVRAIVNQR